MNLLDHVSHDWQTATEIRDSLARSGLDLTVTAVIRMLQRMPSVVERDGKFRNVAFHQP